MSAAATRVAGGTTAMATTRQQSTSTPTEPLLVWATATALRWRQSAGHRIQSSAGRVAALSRSPQWPTPVKGGATLAGRNSAPKYPSSDNLFTPPGPHSDKHSLFLERQRATLRRDARHNPTGVRLATHSPVPPSSLPHLPHRPVLHLTVHSSTSPSLPPPPPPTTTVPSSLSPPLPIHLTYSSLSTIHVPIKTHHGPLKTPRPCRHAP